MFENEYLNFDNLFNDDIDNSDFDFATEESKPDSSEFALQLRREQAINNNPKYIGRSIIYTFLAVFGVTAPIAIIMLLDWTKKSKTAITYGGWRFDEACDALKEIAKLESKREGALSSSSAVKIKQYEKLLEEIDKDRKLKGDPSIKASFNKILKEISKNPGSKEYKELMKILPKKETVDKVLDSAILDYDCSDLDEYDDYDDAEEASANYNLKKAMQYNKKSAKNNYIASQKYKEISENPNVDEDDRRSSARRAKYHMDMAKHHAGKAKDNDFNIKNNKFVSNPYYSNKLKEIYDKDAADEHRKSREESARDGKKRREAYIQANDSRNCKAKEDAFGLFEDDFEFEQDVLALEDAISMLVDEDEREDEFNRAVDEIEEINHPVDEILDEATESTGLFDTSTPAISNGLFEDLLKPATEAVEDDDEDGDLLEEDDGDDDFSDDELDGYVEPKQDYSDKEYDRDEALEEDF